MMRVFKDEIVGWQDGKGAVEFGAAMMFLTSSDMMHATRNTHSASLRSDVLPQPHTWFLLQPIFHTILWCSQSVTVLS